MVNEGKSLPDYLCCIKHGIVCKRGAGCSTVCAVCWRSKVHCECSNLPVRSGSPSRPMKRVQVAVQRSPEVMWEAEFTELAEVVQGVGEQVHQGLSWLTSAMEEQSTRLCEMLSALGQQMGKKEWRMGRRRLVRGRGVRTLVVSEEEEETKEPMELAETRETA